VFRGLAGPTGTSVRVCQARVRKTDMFGIYYQSLTEIGHLFAELDIAEIVPFWQFLRVLVAVCLLESTLFEPGGGMNGYNHILPWWINAGDGSLKPLASTETPIVRRLSGVKWDDCGSVSASGIGSFAGSLSLG